MFELSPYLKSAFRFVHGQLHHIISVDADKRAAADHLPQFVHRLFATLQFCRYASITLIAVFARANMRPPDALHQSALNRHPPDVERPSRSAQAHLLHVSPYSGSLLPVLCHIPDIVF